MATNIFKLNDIEYECEFKLSNPDNQQIIFTKAAIRGMELVDDFFDPFMSGTISIVNPFGLFEQDYVLYLIKELRSKIYILEIDNEALKNSRDMFMNRNAELIRTVDSLKRKLKA